MASRYEKRRLTRILHSPPVLAFFTLFVLLMVSAAWSAYSKQSETAVRRNEATAELADLEAREALLKQNIAKLDTESGIESEIRDRFDVGRAGEHEIVVVDPPPTSTSTAAAPEKPWWQKLFSWF
jgi:cell division protein FtsB